MHIITSQMEKIGVVQFSERMQSILRANFPDWLWLSSAEARSEISNATKRAMFHTLTTESQCATFVLAWFLVGEHFDENCEAARDTFMSTTLSSDEKALWMEDWIKVIMAAMVQRSLP